jgi:hypothetical protein
MQIQPNSIEFQTLEIPWVLIQIIAQILESSNKKVVPYLIPHKSIFYLNFFKFGKSTH